MPRRPQAPLSRSKQDERVLLALSMYPLYRFFGGPQWAWKAAWQHVRKVAWIQTL
jgi:hypothetical protein